MLGAVELNVTRTSGSYVEGVWTPAAPSTFDIEGSLQPLNGRELLLLPEGERSKGSWKLYTEPEVELRVAEAGGAAEADTVAWEGRTLRVVGRLDHGHHTGLTLQHRKYLLREVEV